MGRKQRISLWIALAVSGGCGATFGNFAGEDGWLDHETHPFTEATSLANDGQCAWTGNPFVAITDDRCFSLLYSTTEGDCAELPVGAPAERKTVWSLAPGDDEAQLLIDVSGHEDVRMLDTSEGFLLMGEVDGAEQLYRVDPESVEVLAERAVDAQYWGTRTSPSRRWVVVANSADEEVAPIELIDPRTLGTAQIDPGSTWHEAAWMAQREALAALLYDDDTQSTRIALWDFAGVDALPSGAEMPAPTYDIPMPDVFPTFLMSFTWIGVDPLDRYVVFPVTLGDKELLLLDARDGTVRTTPGSGPLAFTPDGSAIVSFTYLPVEDQPSEFYLEVIDPVTLDRHTVQVAKGGLPTYFVSPDGHEVLVANPIADQPLLIVDLDTGTHTTLDLPLSLTSFTARVGHDEVWIADDGLFRVDLADPLVEPIPLAWTPKNVVWLPGSDLMFLDDNLAPRMILWSPTTRTVEVDAPLDLIERIEAPLSLAGGSADERLVLRAHAGGTATVRPSTAASSVPPCPPEFGQRGPGARLRRWACPTPPLTPSVVSPLRRSVSLARQDLSPGHRVDLPAAPEPTWPGAHPQPGAPREHRRRARHAHDAERSSRRPGLARSRSIPRTAPPPRRSPALRT